ncbi:MAG: hypothetical protein LLG14_12675 [Nocardiaceae bacterium]|nr:hypothetical protein [Nocardiaceae bacterium]
MTETGQNRGPNGSGHRAQKQLERARRDDLVVQLVASGLTFQQVGEQLGVSKSQAHRLFRAALAKIPAGSVDEYRATQREQLNGAVSALWPKVQRADVRACEALVKLLERRARLDGLDAPQVVTGHFDVSGRPIDFAATANDLLARIAASREALSLPVSPGPRTSEGEFEALRAFQEPFPGDATVEREDDRVEGDDVVPPGVEVEAEIVEPAKPWLRPAQQLSVGFAHHERWGRGFDD